MIAPSPSYETERIFIAYSAEEHDMYTVRVAYCEPPGDKKICS